MYEYTARKNSIAGDKKSAASEAPKSTGSIPNSALTEILAGRAHADAEVMGHREDLAPSLAAKMSKAFGMDLSNMQVYHSDAMEGTETRGIAGGNKIVLSNDIDLNTLAGQEVLGHEISHLHAQSQGLGMGHTGLYNDAALESRADAEGMLAARGQSVFGESTGMNMVPGMGNMGELTPLSSGMGISAGAPLQAKKGGKKKPKPPKEKSWQDVLASVPFKADENDISYPEWKKNARKKTNGFDTFAQEVLKGSGKRHEELMGIKAKYERTDAKSRIGDAYTDRVVGELVNERLGDDVENEKIEELMKDLYAPDRDDEKTKLEIKEIYYKELLKRKRDFGRLPAQMDLDDLLERSGSKGFALAFSTGTQFADSNTDKEKEKNNVPFRKENGEVDVEKETEYQNLNDFYVEFQKMVTLANYAKPGAEDPGSAYHPFYLQYQETKKKVEELGEKISGGPELNKKQLKEYQKFIAKKKKKKK